MAAMPLLSIIPQFGWPEILLILGVVLLIFGPQRLPEIAEAMGKSIRKFRSATREVKSEVESEIKRPSDNDRSTDD